MVRIKIKVTLGYNIWISRKMLHQLCSKCP